MSNRFDLADIRAAKDELIEPGALLANFDGTFAIAVAVVDRPGERERLRMEDGAATTANHRDWVSSVLCVASAPRLHLKFDRTRRSLPGNAEVDGIIGFDGEGAFMFSRYGNIGKSATVDLRTWHLTQTPERGNHNRGILHWLINWQLVWVDAHGGETVVFDRMQA